MKQMYLVSYRRYEDDGCPCCTNLVLAESEQAISDSTEYGSCSWLSISKPEAKHDTDALMRRGMPVIEL